MFETRVQSFIRIDIDEPTETEVSGSRENFRLERFDVIEYWIYPQLNLNLQ